MFVYLAWNVYFIAGLVLITMIVAASPTSSFLKKSIVLLSILMVFLLVEKPEWLMKLVMHIRMIHYKYMTRGM